MNVLEERLRQQIQPVIPANIIVPGIVVAVSGGRYYHDTEHVDDVLGTVHRIWTIKLLIEGACPVARGGLDELARVWAKRNEVNSLSVPPKAKKYGWPDAGPLRNGEMATMYPHVWLLFPGGDGTRNAGYAARCMNIPCVEV